MEDQCVTYDIAELLHETDFNLPCYAFYNDNSIDNQKAKCAKKFVSMVGWSDGRENTNNLSSHDFIFVAPLWQQVIDWLITKNILVHPIYTKTNSTISIQAWSVRNKVGDLRWSEKHYSTREIAIMFALQLISTKTIKDI